MRLTVASTSALVAAWLLASVAGMAAPIGQPQYVGTVTGDPERDSYGYVGQAIPQQVVCIVGAKRYFGVVTGDPEKDTFGSPAVVVTGTSCQTQVASKGN